MSFTDDTAELQPRPVRRQGPLTRTVWAFLAFGLFYVTVGAVVGLWGARLFPARPAAPPAAPAAASAPAAPTPPEAPPSPAPAAAAAPDADLAGLKARVQRLETEQRATVDAAAAALAAASLSQAADSSRPFAREVDLLARALPDSRDLDVLRSLAQEGAPTRAGLAAEFPEVAQRAAYASHTPGEQAGLLERFFHAVSAVVTIRRTDSLTGDSVDAVIARAEHAVNDGDFQTAVKELNSLPPAGREETAAWRDKASRRLEIQRRIAAIRNDALRALAASRSLTP